MKRIFTVFIVTLALAGCKKSDEDKVSLNVEKLQLHYNEVHQFKLTKSNKDVENVNWSSSNESVGVIDGRGRFSAKKIGETEIKANGLTCQVTVKPYKNTCAEPYAIFGSSVATIKANDKRSLVVENSTGFSLRGENSKLDVVIYLVTDGKLKSAALIFKPVLGIAEEVNTFFSERYTYLGVDGDYTIFIDGKNVAVGVGYEASLGFHALYIPYTVSSASVATVNNDLSTRIRESREKLINLK